MGHENALDPVGANDLRHLRDRQFRGGRDAPGGGEVLLPQPEPAVDSRLVREQDDSASDADKLAQSADGIGPVVNRQDTHGRIDALVEERQSLSCRPDARRCVRGPLLEHQLGGLHRKDYAIGRLIRTTPGADIHHGPGIAERREHWRFIGRERSSGVTVLRYAIRTEIRLITSELATDLARFPELHEWSTEDLNTVESLFVNSMIVIAEAIEDAQDASAPEEIKRIAIKQLRMIAIGVAGWRSG